MSLVDWIDLPVRVKRSRKRLYSVLSEEFNLDPWLVLPVEVKRSKRRLYDYVLGELGLGSFDDLPVSCRRSTRLFYNFLVDNAGGGGSSVHTCNVTVRDGAGVLSGASVTIEGVTKSTGDKGKVSFELEYGDYSATIVKDGYQSKTESIAFRSNHKNFTIVLEESGTGDGLELVWDASKNATISIFAEHPETHDVLDGIILSDGASAIVDWGDGTTTNYTQASDFNHTYTDEDEYTVTMTVSNGAITGLDEGCFFDMDRLGALLSITLPSTVTSLGGVCFSNCTGLTNITIPQSVTSLGDNCFGGCTSLTNITIPQSVTSLGEYCFNSCTGLTSITMLPLVPPVFGERAFFTRSDISMTVPTGTLQAYQTALEDYDNITITEQ